MLDPVARGVRGEADVLERSGEGLQHVPGSPNVDDRVNVVSGASGREATFGTMQVHELATDERPAGLDALAELDQGAPSRLLRVAHRRKDDRGCHWCALTLDPALALAW